MAGGPSLPCVCYRIEFSTFVLVSVSAFVTYKSSHCFVFFLYARVILLFLRHSPLLACTHAVLVSHRCNSVCGGGVIYSFQCIVFINISKASRWLPPVMFKALCSRAAVTTSCVRQLACLVARVWCSDRHYGFILLPLPLCCYLPVLPSCACHMSSNPFCDHVGKWVPVSAC